MQPKNRYNILMKELVKSDIERVGNCIRRPNIATAIITQNAQLNIPLKIHQNKNNIITHSLQKNAIMRLNIQKYCEKYQVQNTQTNLQTFRSNKEIEEYSDIQYNIHDMRKRRLKFY